MERALATERARRSLFAWHFGLINTPQLLIPQMARRAIPRQILRSSSRRLDVLPGGSAEPFVIPNTGSAPTQ
jgi:hypothetical protein